MKGARLIILLLAVTALSHAQIVSVKSEFEHDSVQIGDQFIYSLSAECGPDVHLTFPIFEETITSEIEVIKEMDIDTLLDENGKRTISKKFLVTSFSPGWNTVPPQAITFQTESFLDTAFTTAALLTVLAPVVDTTQAIKPIKPPINTPITLAEILPIAGISLGGLAVVGLITFLLIRYFRKRKNAETYDGKPLEPADIIALRELEELKEKKLPENGQVKQYYSRLTEIVRFYMSRQFDIPAMESTSDEIIQNFSLVNLSKDELNEMLKELLLLADLVKFAKEDPLMKENEMHMDNALKFINDTKSIFDAAMEEELDELKEGGLNDE